MATIVLSQQAGSAFSEIVISKTLGKNIGEKSSELLNRQTSIVISYQQKKKLRLISPSPKVATSSSADTQLVSAPYNDDWQQVGLV